MAALTYGPDSAAAQHLASTGEQMRHIVAAVGDVESELVEDGFLSLASSIVFQQLSTKAATTIWNRVKAAVGDVTPQAIIDTGIAGLRPLGVSGAKADYLVGLAYMVASEEIDLDEVGRLDDEAVIAELTRIRGVGRWTAEMHLIFSLGREDVFSRADGGLSSALDRLQGVESDDEKRDLVESWAPYRTAASLYLWTALDHGVL